jgi:hypothetical protein
MTQFKCNGCARKTEFLWLDAIEMPDGFKTYQCMSCGAVGVKNITEQIDRIPDTKISRCASCGAWQFEAKPCHTCLLIGEYDANI